MAKEVAILGVGMHPWGKWGHNFVEYGVKAARDAIADSGLDWTDIRFVAGGATILALMLTLITFSISNELEFREGHYKRIREISGLTTIVICASVLLLMFLSFPLGEADVDRGWYLWVYYAVLLGGAATGGVFITIMLMLYYAIRGLVSIGQDPEQSALVITDDQDSH